MPYSFRNRETINAPQRFEDYENDEHRRRPVSYNEPDSGDEVFASPSISARQPRYRGRVVQYNPNLPPAVFPTLDVSRQVPSSEVAVEPSSSLDGSRSPQHSAIQQIIGSVMQHPEDSVEPPSSFDESRSPQHSATQPTSGRAMQPPEGSVETPPSFDASRSPQHSAIHQTIGRAEQHPEGSFRCIMRASSSHPDGRDYLTNANGYGQAVQPQHDGSEESIRDDNMRRMFMAGELTREQEIELEMLTSDEEAAESTKLETTRQMRLDAQLTGQQEPGCETTRPSEKEQRTGKYGDSTDDTVIPTLTVLRAGIAVAKENGQNLHLSDIEGGKMTGGKLHNMSYVQDQASSPVTPIVISTDLAHQKTIPPTPVSLDPPKVAALPPQPPSQAQSGTPATAGSFKFQTPDTPTRPPSRSKQQASESETSFLTMDRGPGARQPKLTEKAGGNSSKPGPPKTANKRKTRKQHKSMDVSTVDESDNISASASSAGVTTNGADTETIGINQEKPNGTNSSQDHEAVQPSRQQQGAHSTVNRS